MGQRLSIDYSLRPATEADRAFFFELDRRTMHEYVVATWGAWDEDFQRQYFDEHFATGNTDVIEIGGESVGIFRLERRDDVLFLAEIQITPEWQGNGIGASLVSDALTQASSLGVPLTLQVLKVNTRACALYERLGLQTTGETQTHFLMST